MDIRDNIKVGDEVTVFRHGNPVCIHRVTRVTKVQILTGELTRWSRLTGRRIPQETYGPYIIPTTLRHRETIARERMIEKIVDECQQDHTLRCLASETLQQIWEALQSGERIE